MSFTFFKTRGFKLFLTIWIVYIFYLQMFGSSCMANSQSALTAAIVNEGRFEIDTYYRSSCDIAFHNGHYYSGQAPGISFISVPIYAVSKPVFYLLPQELIDFVYEEIENYGTTLPVDFEGKKKIPSNYFPDLNKRQILEYIIISGFILPIFTTSLFSALSVLLLYLLLKRFTRNERLRVIIALVYAFGTILFLLSTEFFERPIAITLMFAAFIILFKIKHKEIKPKGSALFASGMLAGLSVWFDYFHLLAAGLLFLYLLSFYRKINAGKEKRILNLDNRNLLLLKFIIGVSLPVLLLLLYHSIIFDDPFATSYSYKFYSGSDHSISGILNIKLPSTNTLFHILEFFLYSPIILLALYGTYKALLKKDIYYSDALAVAVFVIFTFVYNSILAFSYPSALAPQFFRYMVPILPFTLIFLPYIFYAASRKKKVIKIIFLSIGIISILINWTYAQNGVEHFKVEDKQYIAITYFLENGPQSPFLRTIADIFNINALPLNLIGLAVLILLLFIIWKPYLRRNYVPKQS